MVADADLDLVQRIEHVEFRQRYRSEAVDFGRIPGGESVEPAATPRPSGGGAILAAAFADHLAQLFFAGEHLGRKRTLADSGRVGAHDAQHPGDVPGRETGADTRAAYRGVGRRDKGI